MARIVNIHNGKEYKVANPNALLKRFPRTFKMVKAVEIPKEVKEKELEMEVEDQVQSEAETTKKSKTRKRKTEK